MVVDRDVQGTVEPRVALGACQSFAFTVTFMAIFQLRPTSASKALLSPF